MGFNSAFKGLKSLLSSCLRFLPRPSLSSIFSSIMCYTRLFLRSMRSIDLAFLIFLVQRIFLFSLALRNASQFFTRSVQLILFILLQLHISKLTRYFRHDLFCIRICQNQESLNGFTLLQNSHIIQTYFTPLGSRSAALIVSP